MGKENMQNKKPMILVLAGPNGSGKRLYDRGFIYNKDSKDELNVVKIHVKSEESELFYVWDNPVNNMLPELPENLLEYIKEKCIEKIEVQKPYYPKRMHALLEAQDLPFISDSSYLL